jgi:mRNA interferase YafQ
MLNSVTTTRFDKDVFLCRKRGKDLEKIRKVMEKLINEEKLPRKYLDHGLVGSYANRRECHIEPDWLLIYKLEKVDIIFERTGSHSDLFK